MKRVGPLTVITTCAAALGLSCAGSPVTPLRLRGIWHEVAPEDSAFKLATRYGADAAVIIELNDLPENGNLTGREEIFIPKVDGRPPGNGRPVGQRSAVSAAQKMNNRTVKARCGIEGRPCLSWPILGTLIVPFGSKKNGHHDGIDIKAERGSKVVAVADGKVLYSGDEVKGYGNLLIIRHQDGLITVYAHNDKNLVKEGDEVKLGQHVADVGDSGSARTVHLHFEVRVDETPRNPLLYLPSR